MDPEPCPRATESESLVGKIWMSVFKEAKTIAQMILVYIQELELLFVEKKKKKDHTCFWDYFYYEIYWCP